MFVAGMCIIIIGVVGRSSPTPRIRACRRPWWNSSRLARRRRRRRDVPPSGVQVPPMSLGKRGQRPSFTLDRKEKPTAVLFYEALFCGNLAPLRALALFSVFFPSPSPSLLAPPPFFGLGACFHACFAWAGEASTPRSPRFARRIPLAWRRGSFSGVSFLFFLPGSRITLARFLSRL